jgi:hypothetical protein
MGTGGSFPRGKAAGAWSWLLTNFKQELCSHCSTQFTNRYMPHRSSQSTVYSPNAPCFRLYWLKTVLKQLPSWTNWLSTAEHSTDLQTWINLTFNITDYYYYYYYDYYHCHCHRAGQPS